VPGEGHLAEGVTALGHREISWRPQEIHLFVGQLEVVIHNLKWILRDVDLLDAKLVHA